MFCECFLMLSPYECRSPTTVRIFCNTDLVSSAHIHINYLRHLFPFGIFQI